MIAQSEIRREISRYLRGDISLDRFEDWLVQHSWNMQLDSDEAAQKLAASVELRLAEHSSGHLNESELREQLRSFVNQFTMRIEFGSAPIASEEIESQNKTAEVAPQVITFQGRFGLPSQGASVLVDTGRATVLV
jgi:hypothetical protein